MAKAKDVLSAGEYRNYRNVRAAAVLFVVVGSMLALGGLVGALDREANPEGGVSPVAAAVLAVVGLAGAGGGVAALRGNRRWAKLAYVIAIPYLLAIPLGTVMGYVMLSGLSRYLDSRDRVRQATTGEA